MAGKGIALSIVALVMGIVLLLVLLSGSGFFEDSDDDRPTRDEAIPDDAVKMLPQTDLYPPILHSDEWKAPVPMSGPVNSAGAEDSPFVSPDGDRFWFFFTPDVDVPPEKQLIDDVTGIWWCEKANGSWTEPERIILNDDVALDGAEFVQDDTMWFASVRAGNYGEIDYYTAELEDGDWGNVENAGEQLNVEYDIGEMHIASDGQTMYFHTGAWSVDGDMDLYLTTRTGDGWSDPVEVPGVNTDMNEGYPFVSSDGEELWFTGQSKLGHPGPALYRAVKNGTAWDEPVEIVSSFAGECTLDDDGNLYFVHHYYSANMTMIEADIYVAMKANDAMTVSMSDEDAKRNGMSIPTIVETFVAVRYE